MKNYIVNLLRAILCICLVIASHGYATTTAVAYGYEVNTVQPSAENLNNNGLINPSGCCSKSSSRDSQDRAQARAFFAFAADLDVPKGTSSKVDYSPINHGPLGNPNDAGSVASTFRSGTYSEVVTEQPVTLYRVISDNGNPTGSYWTSVKPKGPLQSVIDSALDQNWGNTATRVVTAKVPAGTKIYEGAAAAQRGLVGGGNQIYIPKVDPKWIQ